MAASEAATTIAVTVVCSPRAGQVDEVELTLPAGSSVGQALQQSGLLQRYPGMATAAVGVWGRARGHEVVLRDRDRVEIYRPLVVDPKEARRLRQRRQDAR
jgi:putative ubiquitin-RnfH superfamily antitoxin RatB of RatAB toxin-antitoxin module